MGASAKEIKELRAKTGAGISDVKRALEESGGDLQKAFAAIQRKLGSAAGKRRDRETRAGLVEAYLHSDGRIGALVEVFCETDFVARNPEFRKLAHELAMQIAAMPPEHLEALHEQDSIHQPGRAVEEIIREAIGKFGENIRIGRFARFEI